MGAFISGHKNKIPADGVEELGAFAAQNGRQPEQLVGSGVQVRPGHDLRQVLGALL